MAEPARTSNQSRIGIEGRGGSKSHLISRSSFRYVFVGGMVAAGSALFHFRISILEVYMIVIIYEVLCCGRVLVETVLMGSRYISMFSA